MRKTSFSGEPVASAHWDAELVRSELVRLLKSDQFKNSKRCQSLLSYVVEETLAERTDQLKERLVGVNVFGRSPDYDTAEDPVVRNAAIEVRKRLAQYYVESGRDSALTIHLHAGKYAPEFRCRDVTSQSSEPRFALHTPDLEPFSETAEPKFRVSEPKQLPQGNGLEEMPAVQRRRPWILLWLLPLALVLTTALYLLRPFRRPAASTDAAEATSGQSTSSPSPTAPGKNEVRILAGNQNPGPYVDRFGDEWSPDNYFHGGEAKSGGANFFFPPADPTLFRTVRQGTFSYEIPLKATQTYVLRLYFVEPQYRYGNKVGGDGENIRLFQVRANGRILLDYFDIVKDAGYASTSVRAFKDITAGNDGKLHLDFIPEREQPLLSAIELLPMNGQLIPPIRIHTAPSQYTDHEGRRWSADNFYLGGQWFDPGTPVLDTKDPDLFNVERVGNFSYAIPVPSGRYTLTLYFADTWFKKPGQRVFDVTCNGVLLIHDVDLLQQAGFSKVYQKTFRGLEPNGQGKLLISFSPRVDYATVRALEITQE